MFEMVHNRQLIFGEDTIAQLPALLKWRQLKKPMIAVYSPDAPCLNALCQELKKEGISWYLHAGIHGEPDLNCVNLGRDIFLSNGCDCTIAIGGGSVIDAAKAINMLAVNGGMMEEYQMEGRPVTVAPPFFAAIPTTSGTGAEATKTSVVLNNHNGLKKSLYHTSMIADVVILDPTVTLELPPSVTAATGMDALSHAIESYVSLNASPITEMYGLKAVSLISKNLAEAVRQPDSLTARGNMMLASYFGGVAITAGIGIAHIMAQPLGAVFQIPHGDACSVFLPISIQLNRDHAKKRYVELAKAFGVSTDDRDDDQIIDRLLQAIRTLQDTIQAPVSLKPWLTRNLSEEELLDTVKRTTGHITCNPRPLDEALILEAWRAAL